MSSPESQASQVSYQAELESENLTVLKALAVVSERLLIETGDGAFVVTDSELQDSPDLEVTRISDGVEFRTRR